MQSHQTLHIHPFIFLLYVLLSIHLYIYLLPSPRSLGFTGNIEQLSNYIHIDAHHHTHLHTLINVKTVRAFGTTLISHQRIYPRKRVFYIGFILCSGLPMALRFIVKVKQLFNLPHRERHHNTQYHKTINRKNLRASGIMLSFLYCMSAQEIVFYSMGGFLCILVYL